MSHTSQQVVSYLFLPHDQQTPGEAGMVAKTEPPGDRISNTMPRSINAAMARGVWASLSQLAGINFAGPCV